MYVYIYTYMYIYVCIYIYIYLHLVIYTHTHGILHVVNRPIQSPPFNVSHSGGGWGCMGVTPPPTPPPPHPMTFFENPPIKAESLHDVPHLT